MGLPTLSPKAAFFALIAGSVALEVAADVLLKKWSINDKGLLLYSGLALYFLGTVLWAFSLRHEMLSKAISVFTVLNLVLVVLAGVFIFKEDLSLMNKAGIVLGIISIILLES